MKGVSWGRIGKEGAEEDRVSERGVTNGEKLFFSQSAVIPQGEHTRGTMLPYKCIS